MCKIDVLVDSRLAATVADRSFAKVRIPVGRHGLTFRWPLFCTKDPLNASIGIKAGETRYLVVTGDQKISGFYVIMMTVKQTTQVVEVTPAEGERLIQQLKR